MESVFRFKFDGVREAHRILCVGIYKFCMKHFSCIKHYKHNNGAKL
jgi:hypothetical protein